MYWLCTLADPSDRHQDHTTETFLPPPVQDLLRRILKHEELERKWAIECEVEGDIDSTALLNLAKERVRNSQDASEAGRLHAMAVALNNLYHLRLELANWRISGMKMILPNSSAGRPVGSGGFKVYVASPPFLPLVADNVVPILLVIECSSSISDLGPHSWDQRILTSTLVRMCCRRDDDEGMSH